MIFFSSSAVTQWNRFVIIRKWFLVQSRSVKCFKLKYFSMVLLLYQVLSGTRLKPNVSLVFPILSLSSGGVVSVLTLSNRIFMSILFLFMRQMFRLPFVSPPRTIDPLALIKSHRLCWVISSQLSLSPVFLLIRTLSFFSSAQNVRQNLFKFRVVC